MHEMSFFQETLFDDLVILNPLEESDFERLYEVASDPLIWEQHPNKDRYQRPIFENFFKGALASQGAYIVLDKESGEVVGSSRFYDFNEETSSVMIGYTFIGRKFWGKGYNQSMKKLMMDHAFKKVDKIFFHVGAQNKRSQIAMERLGGKIVRNIEVAYYGEPTKLNIEYLIERK